MDCNKVTFGCPFLYNFYIDDVIISVSDAVKGCKLGAYLTNLACYADDMILMAATFSELQQLLQKIYNGLREHCLKINFNKSKFIVFKKKLKVDLMD